MMSRTKQTTVAQLDRRQRRTRPVPSEARLNRRAAGVRKRGKRGRGQQGASSKVTGDERSTYATGWRTTAPFTVSVPNDRKSWRSVTDNANPIRRSRRATTAAMRLRSIAYNSIASARWIRSPEPADELTRILVRINHLARDEARL